MTVVQDFIAKCHEMDATGRPTDNYVIDLNLVRRLYYVMMNDDSEESEFHCKRLRAAMADGGETTHFDAPYIQHLIEYLKEQQT